MRCSGSAGDAVGVRALCSPWGGAAYLWLPSLGTGRDPTRAARSEGGRGCERRSELRGGSEEECRAWRLVHVECGLWSAGRLRARWGGCSSFGGACPHARGSWGRAHPSSQSQAPVTGGGGEAESEGMARGKLGRRAREKEGSERRVSEGRVATEGMGSSSQGLRTTKKPSSISSVASPR